MPYKNKNQQRDAMREIMRNFREREKQRQIEIERTLRRLDKSAWEALYGQKKRGSKR
jgi:hypothetical protein